MYLVRAIRNWHGVISVLFVMSAAACSTAYDPARGGPPDINDRWFLTFESEFEIPRSASDRGVLPIDSYDSLVPDSDNAKWEYRDGPNKGAYAVGPNAFISKGDTQDGSVLILRTSLDADPDPAEKRSNPLRTGYIRTRNYENTGPDQEPTFTQKFGYFEARMKFASSPGQWGAFWLMPQRKIWCADGSGRDATEIDIVEGFPSPPGRTRNREKGVNLAIHYDGYGRFHQKQDLAFPEKSRRPIWSGFDASEYHNYGLLWTPDSYTWYVDGLPVAHIDDPNLISQREKYLKLSTEVAGWAGNIDPRLLPADTKVDWVKVWQSEKMMRGNPYVFEVEKAPVTLADNVQVEVLETGTWCTNSFARARGDSIGRLTIPIKRPVEGKQIGIRVSNTINDQSWVKLVIDGVVTRTWDTIDLDTLFILKHSAEITVSEEIELLWSDDVVIDQIYIVPAEPIYAIASEFS